MEDFRFELIQGGHLVKHLVDLRLVLNSFRAHGEPQRADGDVIVHSCGTHRTYNGC